ncbi:ABC-2 type transport system ATP-binding protein [Herbihabitans rhizosphaerae]|uniref:ABC-2 type transport system ATP-binding protein n=1 Tax=Herbihabitans rhizosphaerae TaxID=1872711 RepID=A0A4Q7KJE5_9PSEU|nr:ABC transporter ATP-binding protein [Herbihabitans rhizosphaerae]RZS34734.1 ABC-2 type transport system ATP-binding protein [Herbihabitans rhizosphaerae]
MTESAIVEATGLGKRYRRTWALRDCSLSIPTGRVVALVGPNGAGKTTFLHLAVGLLDATLGSVSIKGATAFLAQDKPLYTGFTIAEMLKFGKRLNPGWDDEFALKRIDSLQLPLKHKVGKLSGGQRAQVALTLALAKRPDLLVLDEPLANLDPLARHEVMRGLMEAVAETGMTVLLSSHVVSDLENTCDWLIVLNGGRVQVSGDIDELVAGHRILTGPAEEADSVSRRVPIVEDTRSGRQATLFARTEPVPLSPQWSERPVSLEQMVLAYLRRPDSASLPRPTLATA